MKTIENQKLQDLLSTTLRQTFGFQEFRGIQLEAIQTLMTHGSLLCILPTGYGKSLLYQLPASLQDGITIVISPLLALIRDQVEQLNKRFKIPAMAINSDQTDEENYWAHQAARQDMLKILFVAPEQLDHVDRFNFLLNLNVKLIVVDEAHCISTWGHDFRPSYRQIIHLVHAIHAKNKEIKILGLTATANQRVEEDIKKQLFFSDKEPCVIRQTLNRPNIQLSTLKTKGIPAKLVACEELLRNLEGCGLIYCATRENTELVAEYLEQQGLNVTSYHAGYESTTKQQLQKDFLADKYKALAATNALGMGIDKGNLRFIIHFDFPGSITAYYQEVGRCGRDGQKAKGVLLYDSSDQSIHDYFIESALPSQNDFKNVIEAIANSEAPLGLTAIKTATGLHPTRVTIVIAELIEQSFLTKYSSNGKQVYQVLPKKTQPNLTRYINQHEVKSHELKQMLSYGAQSEKCRMSILRLNLGDTQPEDCGHCDCCSKDNVEKSISADKIALARIWLNKRPITIASMIKEKVSAGLSVLDGKLRSPLFVRFMKERANCPENTLGMDPELLDLLKMHLSVLARNHRTVGIVPLPSRTWQMRDKVATFLADHLQVPVFDLLVWKKLPLKRQGELFNNNQRHENVHYHMQVDNHVPIPKGALFLFDDYIGSGNSLKEAARALRFDGINNELVPFTVAALKWKLGKQGFL